MSEWSVLTSVGGGDNPLVRDEDCGDVIRNVNLQVSAWREPSRDTTGLVLRDRRRNDRVRECVVALRRKGDFLPYRPLLAGIYGILKMPLNLL